MSIAGKPAPFGPDLRAALVAMVRKRVPESEVEDIVQQALTEAIDSPHAPEESEALRRWIFGVAKNKIVDYHRRAGRETFDLPDVAGSPAPHVEADLLRWAERNLPEGAENHKTLDWMLREGEGEKLETIAEDEKLPAPRVRQRVSRLRRHFKENWRREVTLLAALGVVVTAVLFVMLRKSGPEIITHENVPDVAPLRRAALEKCAKAEWKECVEKLDEARRLDPAGDAVPEVQQARQAAESARQAPSPSSSVQPPPPPSSVQAPAPGPSAVLAPPPAPSGPTKAAPAPRMDQKSDGTSSRKPAAPGPPLGGGKKKSDEALPAPPAVFGPKS